MSKKLFTPEEQMLLKQNPFTEKITARRLSLTVEFKEIFLQAYNEGGTPKQIFEDHGFDVKMLGDKRIRSIAQHIREQYEKHGGFSAKPVRQSKTGSNAKRSGKDEIKYLQDEVEYLRQELDFLKKIIALKTSGK